MHTFIYVSASFVCFNLFLDYNEAFALACTLLKPLFYASASFYVTASFATHYNSKN